MEDRIYSHRMRFIRDETPVTKNNSPKGVFYVDREVDKDYKRQFISL